MKAKHWLASLYSTSLLLYPGRIRAEFGSEMLDVFERACRAAEREGWLSLTNLVLRELFNLPGNLLRAYWELAKENFHMGISVDLAGLESVGPNWRGFMNGRENMPMDRRQALAAGLPVVLVGAGVAVGAVLFDGPLSFPLTWKTILPLLAPFAPGMILGVICLWAALQGLPDWSLSWLGSFLMGLTLFTKVMAEEMVDEGSLVLSPALDLLLAAAILLAGLVVLLFLARRGWEQAGLFTAAAASIFGLSLLQAVMAAPYTRTDLAILAGPSGLLFGGLIYLYAKSSGWGRLAVLPGLGLINAGLVVLVASAWQDRLSAAGRQTPLVPLLAMISMVLVAGPLAGFLMKVRRPR